MNLRPSVLALSSAALLILAFPNFNQTWCAWIALVPWLLALQQLRPGRQAWWVSWFVGMVFFLGSMWWLTYVTVVGWIILCAYLALFFGAFGWLASRMMHGITRAASRSMWDGWLTMLGLPAIWVALEYARSHLLTGLGWNLLGYAQASQVPLIQIAEVTGVWGVSCVIVLVNVAIAESIRTRTLTRIGAAVVIVLAVVGYGTWRLPQVVSAQTVRVAVLQGNIPQDKKWDEEYREPILER